MTFVIWTNLTMSLDNKFTAVVMMLKLIDLIYAAVPAPADHDHHDRPRPEGRLASRAVRARGRGRRGRTAAARSATPRGDRPPWSPPSPTTPGSGT